MTSTQNITIMGGGNGGSISIRAMKNYLDYYDLSAIIAVSDSGGSSGELREEMDVLPPGDLLRAVLAMSKYDYRKLANIFRNNRFKDVNHNLEDHNLGNLFLSLVDRYGGNAVDAIDVLSQAVEAQGDVYPTTTADTHLCVELSNGDVVKGEHKIDRPDYDRSLKIEEAWLEPEPEVYEGARKAILNSDYIIIGPGSFYASIVATLLPEGVEEAIENSDAKIIYVPGNAIEKNGETGPERLSEFVDRLQEILPRRIDKVIFNNATLDDRQKQLYEKRNWKKMIADIESVEHDITAAPYESREDGLDPDKLGNLLHDYIKKTS
ncbi:MAG: uridine diphosphate-N-acetylglucosamine-binding protein YvcK [Candidatus Magasanikbacteria bacterium]